MQTPDFQIFYKKTDLTHDLKNDVIELTYTDLIEGESDELSVTFYDPSNKWINDWFPTQGDVLSPAIGYKGQTLTALGQFEIDEIEYSTSRDGGTVVSLKALATGIMKSNRTLKPKAFENTTLDKIVATIAKKQGLTLVGKVKPIPVQRITQYQETDLQFLMRLGVEYRYSFKIVGKNLSFYPISTLETAEPVRVLQRHELITVQLSDKIKDAVKKVKVVGYNAKEKKRYQAEQGAKTTRQGVAHATNANGDTLNITVRAESQAQMDAIAASAIAKKRELDQSGRITLYGDPLLVAGQTVKLQGLGVFSGKYLIIRATHRLSQSNGYTTDLEIRMTEYDNAAA